MLLPMVVWKTRLIKMRLLVSGVRVLNSSVVQTRRNRRGQILRTTGFSIFLLSVCDVVVVKVTADNVAFERIRIPPLLDEPTLSSCESRTNPRWGEGEGLSC